jgi:hypothetical protein
VFASFATTIGDVAFKTAAISSAVWIAWDGTARLWASSSWLSRRMPEPMPADTAVRHSAKSFSSTPG